MMIQGGVAHSGVDRSDIENRKPDVGCLAGRHEIDPQARSCEFGNFLDGGIGQGENIRRNGLAARQCHVQREIESRLDASGIKPSPISATPTVGSPSCSAGTNVLVSPVDEITFR